MAESALDLMIISWWQLGAGTIGIGLLILTLRYTRQATKAAVDAAKSAEDAVTVTKETAQAQLRAYVICDGAEFLNFKSERPLVQTMIKNFGQTPAYDVRCAFQYKFTHAVAEPIETPKFIEKDWSTLGILAPGSFIGSVTDLEESPLPSEAKNDLLEGRAIFYVIGEVRYRDVHSEPRWTTFKYMFGGDNIMDPEYSFSICKDGNEAN